ncbi:hypothetical protein BpHYR1_015669 [Brachionus plicatilis]|uniref:Uncharacterized protein n=1 Tax=Brachionus plicatilis TaxID=10195 RepID=A0A3M7RBM8_BRAPC|nr:hypothetical protein BpHYR1_015669 [Brachionus plicatilis]
MNSVHLMSGKLKSPVTNMSLYRPISTAQADSAIYLLISAAISFYLTLSLDARAFRGVRSEKC